MKLVIMQPYLFPYVGYFQLLAAADRFVIYDDVNFIKGGWINRNHLLVNSQSWLFTIPLNQPSPYRLINEIEVQPARHWQPKLLQTITQNYRRAPYFESVFRLVETIFTSDAPTIAQLVTVSLQNLVRYLELPVELVLTSAIYGNAHLHSQERVIDICCREGATQYLNASGGMALYNGEDFRRAGIELFFLKPRLHPYPQLNKSKEFVPGLSIIDLLMNNSPTEARQLLQHYTLIPA